MWEKEKERATFFKDQIKNLKSYCYACTCVEEHIACNLYMYVVYVGTTSKGNR